MNYIFQTWLHTWWIPYDTTGQQGGKALQERLYRPLCRYFFHCVCPKPLVPKTECAISRPWNEKDKKNCCEYSEFLLHRLTIPFFWFTFFSSSNSDTNAYERHDIIAAINKTLVTLATLRRHDSQSLHICLVLVNTHFNLSVIKLFTTNLTPYLGSLSSFAV